MLKLTPQTSMASMNYFDSDMSNSTNTVVHFNGKGGHLYLHLWGRSHTIYVVQVCCSIFQPARFEQTIPTNMCFYDGKVLLMEQP